ncbi:MAG: DUF4162 domain-containing protein, partial [Phycisphaerae bacterium]
TIIRMIAGIFGSDAGRVSVLGAPSGIDVRRRVGYLPEEKGLYKKMTALDLLTYFARLKGVAVADARQRGAALMQRYGLGDRVNARAETFSKGMQQKLQLLMTILHEPELLILDEPFSGLDPVNMEMMRDMILEQKQAGRTILFSTHIMEQAEKMCDHVCLIHKSRKILDGPLAEVKDAHSGGIILEYDGDGSFLNDLPNVSRVNNYARYAEIFLRDSAPPQELLRLIVDRLSVRKFEIAQPSLHEIFVRNVKDAE